MALEGNAAEPPPASPGGHDLPGMTPPTVISQVPGGRRAQAGRLIRIVLDSDQDTLDEAVLRLSRSRRWLAPLALAIGALGMVFEGVKLLFTNWRLTLIQVLPAMWIWVAMLDLKAHVLHGRSFHVLTGPIVVPVVLVVAGITAASFFLNAVFAFAIAQPGAPRIRPAFTRARARLAIVLGWGFVVGLGLGLSTVVFTRWGLRWFAISLGIVIAVMMFCYVAVPARLIGMRTTHSKRDSMTATAVVSVMSAVVCTPAYVLGRVGLLMIGSSALLIPGIIVLTVGLTLQAGTTSAIKTVKMSATLISGHQRAGPESPGSD
jgi:hypothetical protein